MSDDERRSLDEAPAEPLLLPPESPFASPPQGPPSPPQPPLSELPRRPRIWTVFAAFALSQALGLVAGIVIFTCLLIWSQGADPGGPADGEATLETILASPSGFLGSLLATMIVFALVAVTAAALSPVPWRKRLRLRAVGVSPLAVLVTLCGILAVGFVLDALDTLEALPQSPVLEMLGGFVATLSGPTLWAAVLVIGIAPGIAEELLFRGYIQTRLSKRWGPAWAILATSLLFGLNHWDLVQGTFAVAIGIYLGYLTERTGTIWPAMFCHAANNALATLAAAEGVDLVGFLGPKSTIIAAIVFVCFSALCLPLLLRGGPRSAG